MKVMILCLSVLITRSLWNIPGGVPGLICSKVCATQSNGGRSGLSKSIHE